MGNRLNRKKPTCAEKKMRGTKGGGQRTRDGRKIPENPRARRREVSLETRELVAAYAKVMGWTPEQVLPAENTEAHHV